MTTDRSSVYASDSSFCMNVRYGGDSFDPLKTGDDISMSIIRNLAVSCEHSFDADGNHLCIKIT